MGKPAGFHGHALTILAVTAGPRTAEADPEAQFVGGGVLRAARSATYRCVYFEIL
jgi:hypothetical protein